MLNKRKIEDWKIEEAQKMKEFFMEIWAERPHKSQLSGRSLGSEPFTCMFDHLLEKGRYPEFKYEKDNIILVTCEEHALKTDGHPLPKHLEAIEKAKQKFLYGKPDKE